MACMCPKTCCFSERFGVPTLFELSPGQRNGLVHPIWHINSYRFASRSPGARGEFERARAQNLARARNPDFWDRTPSPRPARSSGGPQARAALPVPARARGWASALPAPAPTGQRPLALARGGRREDGAGHATRPARGWAVRAGGRAGAAVARGPAPSSLLARAYDARRGEERRRRGAGTLGARRAPPPARARAHGGEELRRRASARPARACAPARQRPARRSARPGRMFESLWPWAGWTGQTRRRAEGTGRGQAGR